MSGHFKHSSIQVIMHRGVLTAHLYAVDTHMVLLTALLSSEFLGSMSSASQKLVCV